MRSIFYTVLSCLILFSATAQKFANGIRTSYVVNKSRNSYYHLLSYKENMPRLENVSYSAKKHKIKTSRNNKSNNYLKASKSFVGNKHNDSLSHLDSNITNTINTIVDSNLNEKCYLLKYYLYNNGNFKYNLHVEGIVHDCNAKVAISHAYISLNSAIETGRYMIVPTRPDGKFDVDVIDDSIGSITVIKKGYIEKNIQLKEADFTFKNSVYAFNLCIEKEGNDDKVISKSIPQLESNAIVHFGFNKTILQKSTKNVLDSLINVFKETNKMPNSIELNGYADGKGAKKYNLELSRKRAIACKRYLISNGLSRIKIKVGAFGSKNPIENEKIGKKDNPLARAENRRVEIVIH